LASNVKICSGLYVKYAKSGKYLANFSVTGKSTLKYVGDIRVNVHFEVKYLEDIIVTGKL